MSKEDEATDISPNVERRQAYGMVECSDEWVESWFGFFLQLLELLDQVVDGPFAVTILYILVVISIVMIVVTRDCLVLIASSRTLGNCETDRNSLIPHVVVLINGHITVQVFLDADIPVLGHSGSTPLLV